MKITLRFPIRLLVVLGALVATALGSIAAAILPTPLEGYLNGHPVHEPTSVAMYVMTGVTALVVFLVALMVVRRGQSPGGRAA